MALLGALGFGSVFGWFCIAVSGLANRNARPHWRHFVFLILSIVSACAVPFVHFGILGLLAGILGFGAGVVAAFGFLRGASNLKRGIVQ